MYNLFYDTILPCILHS